MSVPANSLANIMLSQALTAMGLSQVAWGGQHGQEHYRMTASFSESLASLAAWAHNANELLNLTAGWMRAQNCQSRSSSAGPVTVVIEECSPKVWETLRLMQLQNTPLTVILMDEQRRYTDSSCLNGGLQAYAASLGIHCSNPTECNLLSSITQHIDDCLNHPGVSLVHLLGPESAQTEQIFNRTFDWNRFPQGQYNLHAKEIPSLEAAALVRLLPELMQLPDTVALWTRSLHPGPLIRLGPRLQYCSINGLVWQIAGLVNQHYHPAVFLSAANIPLLLPELMGLAGCPVTFVILDGCSSPYTADGKRQPIAKLHDLALLNTVPEMVLAEPADEEDARSIMAALLKWPGLSAMRLIAVPAINIPPAAGAQPLSIGQGRILRPGRDLSFACLGPNVNVALLAIETLNSWGFQAGVYDMRFLHPLDIHLLKDALQTGRIITVEDHSVSGGLGSAAANAICDSGLCSQLQKLIKVGLDQDFMECAPEDHGISLNSLLQAAKEALELY